MRNMEPEPCGGLLGMVTSDWVLEALVLPGVFLAVGILKPSLLKSAALLAGLPFLAVVDVGNDDVLLLFPVGFCNSRILTSAASH